MKYWLVICCFWGLMGCASKGGEQPVGGAFNLQLATEGVSRFEDYIHSLNIYAFRKTAGGGYVYHGTLAELDAKGIAALADGSARGDSKYFTTNLAVGIYILYLAGNVAGHLSGQWIEGVTTPSDVVITGNPDGQDSTYFLGSVLTEVIANEQPPVRVTLNRAVSKLVFVLYGVPVEIDSVRVTLGNLATAVSLDGRLSGEGKVITENLLVRKLATNQKDTIVGQMLTLPSLAGGSPLRLTFYSASGVEKVKEMPEQMLLPDKYIRVTGVINDDPGALLSFEVVLRLLIVDSWLDYTLPDFILNKRES